VGGAGNPARQRRMVHHPAAEKVLRLLLREGRKGREAIKKKGAEAPRCQQTRRQDALGACWSASGGRGGGTA